MIYYLNKDSENNILTITLDDSANGIWKTFNPEASNSSYQEYLEWIAEEGNNPTDRVLSDI